MEERDLPPINGAVAVYIDGKLEYSSKNLVVYTGLKLALYALSGYSSSNNPSLNEVGVGLTAVAPTLSLNNAGIPGTVYYGVPVWDGSNHSVFSGETVFAPGDIPSVTINMLYLFSNRTLGRTLFSAIQIQPLVYNNATSLVVVWKLSKNAFPDGVFDATFDVSFD